MALPSSTLRPRQRQELEGAILQYLESKHPQSARQFETEANIQVKNWPLDDLLVKKWVATTRMQLKIRELEKENAELENKLKMHVQLAQFTAADDGLPTAPPTHVLEGHRLAVTSCAFHPLFLILVSASDDGTMNVWQYETGRLERSFNEHTEAVNDIAFDVTGKRLASASSDASVKIWDFTRMECARTLYGHDSAVSTVRFVPGADQLLSASKDRTAKLWDSILGSCLRTFSAHNDALRGLTVHETGKIFATCSNDFTINLWRKDQSYPVRELLGHDHVVESVAFAPQSMVAYLAKANLAPQQAAPELMVPDSELAQREEGGEAGPLSPLLEYGPVIISCGRDRTIRTWDAWGGKCLKTFSGHDNWVNQVLPHPNGQYVVSCSDDRSIRVWDVQTGECISTLLKAHNHFITSLAFSLQTGLLASGSLDKSVKVWGCNTAHQEA